LRGAQGEDPMTVSFFKLALADAVVARARAAHPRKSR